MSSNGRIFVMDDISSDTGEVNASGLVWTPNPAAGLSEEVVSLRMRLKTHTADASGQYLCSVRWNDGVGDQSWDVSLSVTAGNYAEVGMQIWCDASRDVTVQVVPLVAGGSIDVLILGEF